MRLGELFFGGDKSGSDSWSSLKLVGGKSDDNDDEDFGDGDVEDVVDVEGGLGFLKLRFIVVRVDEGFR